MNILFLSTEIPYPPDSGHRLRTYNILKQISREHKVFLLGFLKRDDDAGNLEGVRELCEDVEAFVIPDDVSRLSLAKSLFLNLFSSSPYVAEKYHHRGMRDSILARLERQRIDLVHFDMLPLAEYMRYVPGLPSVLVEHNVESIRLRRLSANNRNAAMKIFLYYQYRKLLRYERREVRRFDLCTAVSEADKAALEIMSPGAKVTVVPNGVDTAYFSGDGSRVEPNSLVWVGAMNDPYNREAVDFFCDDIYPLIKRKVPDLIFNVVGTSPTRRLTGLSMVDGNISITGYVDDIRPYVNRAAVYIAPIRSGGGTKLKVLNAMSMGKAVVTTSVGAEGIDARDNEHLIVADAPGLFAEKTVELLRDDDLARRIGKSARALIVGKYDWARIGEEMNRLYDGVIDYAREGEHRWAR